MSAEIESRRAVAADPFVSSPGWWLLWALLAVVWFGSLGTRALFNPDEGRYATLSLHVLQSGDWITPRLNGLIYFEKPALPYWMGAIGMALFGASEFGARFWPGVAGFATVAAVGLTGRRLWGPQVGALSAFLAAGMAWIVANAHFLNVDMSLTLFLTLALCGFLCAQHDGASARQQQRGMWLCWAAMAGAVLSKGLVGVLIPGAVLFLYAAVQRDLRLWRRLHLGSGLLIFLALALPWFIAVQWKNPGFYDFFVVDQHFRRYLTDAARRGGPPYYFVPVLVLGLLPWVSPLAGALWLGVRGEAGARFQPLRALLIWNLFIFIFFSVSRSKLHSYILPMFPALALMMGVQFASMGARRLRGHLLGGVLLWVALAIGVWTIGESYAARQPEPAVALQMAQAIEVAALMALATLAVAWWCAGRGRPTAAVGVVALGMSLALTAIGIGHDAYARYAKSSRDLVPLLHQDGYLQPDTPVFSVGSYDQTLPFYLGRPSVLVQYVDEFAFGQAAEPERLVPTLDAFDPLWRSLPRAAALMEPDMYAALQARGLPMRVLSQNARRVLVVKPLADMGRAAP